MQTWQVDCYRRPSETDTQEEFWELWICEPSPGEFRYRALCPQSELSRDWLLSQLKQFSTLPDRLLVFRPTTLHLLEPVAQALGIELIPTRRTPTLKQWIVDELKQPIALDRPPPLPLPEELWGDRWRFATINAQDLIEGIGDRPIPIKSLPKDLWPINLGLPSTVSIPGVIIDGDRQSLQLTQWFLEANPISLNFIPGQPDGLILESGLSDRWIITTFEDREVRQAGYQYEQRKQQSKGLHFLLIQPDNSGMTYTGLWLLQPENECTS
ncbi:Tab2/Atab2 family RNA-binding protein [Roseofilum sp. BLCC_M154]|uniref:Tab2/Atab2 family RNA-binding protein n=1 Tax=Roseofilum acuticapitatum BLCC-M154 TaxID=3022444 RepID=A0ABT7APQ7_9CYAN|nr:Tab2 family RNA-binding protein [Roseofilum acuticapitatum]MDJ1168885.1 Tab2/Atab2 family RNA-binding protein [Roseofilum acuticapitatum BLCC-M154]